jgi:hypothetical protein
LRSAAGSEKNLFVSVLLLVALALVGAGFVGYGAYNVMRALRVRSWRPVDAVVIERRVLTTPVLIGQWHTAYYPFARFRYETPRG